MFHIQSFFKEKPNPKPKKIKYLPGVIYISRLPWGFEEKQLREYFSQFGSIRNLMVSRSFKVGGLSYVHYYSIVMSDICIG